MRCGRGTIAGSRYGPRWRGKSQGNVIRVSPKLQQITRWRFSFHEHENEKGTAVAPFHATEPVEEEKAATSPIVLLLQLLIFVGQYLGRRKEQTRASTVCVGLRVGQ